MPRGKRVKDYPAPHATWCDFCGRAFYPLAWNERTCYRCEHSDPPCPNQSKMEWGEYQRALLKFLRAIGRRSQRSVTAHALESFSRGRIEPQAAFRGRV